MFRIPKVYFCVHRLVSLLVCMAILAGLSAGLYGQGRESGPASPVPAPTAPSVPLNPVNVPVTHTKTTDPPLPVAMNLLVITVTGFEPGFNAITTFLQEIGVPYQAIALNNITPDSQGNYFNNLTLTNAATGEGLYQGIILTTGNLGGLPSTADWTKLDTYTGQYGIRTISYYTYPDPRYGLTPVDAGAYYTTTNPLNVNLTAAASTIFPYLVQTATIPVEEAVLSVEEVNGIPVKVTSNGVYAYLANTTQAAGESTTSILTTTTGYTVGAAHTTADGRQSIALTMDNDVPLLHSVAFNYGLINWVTKGVFLGSRQIYLSTHTDDLFMGDDLFNCGSCAIPYIRSTPTDISALVSWQTAKQSNPLFSGFKNIIPYVGGYAVLTGGDPLVPAVESNLNQFFWISHTYDHTDLDSYNLTQSLAEITQNLTVAQQLGMTVDMQSMITPFDSGLTNSSFLQAAQESGITYLMVDAGYASGQPATPGIGIVDPVNTSILLVPRRDTNLYWDVDVPTTGVPGSLPDEYNSNFASLLGYNATYSQIIASEASSELINILHYEPYPLAFHISNIVAYDGTHSLFTDLFDSVMSGYQSMFNLPLKTLQMKDVGPMLLRRAAYNTSGAAGVYTPGGNVMLTIANAATVPITGACSQSTCPTYGGQTQDAVTMSAGGTATLTLNNNLGTAISSITLNPTSVTGGNTSTGTVTLTAPAPAGGVPIAVSNSNETAVTIPTNVTVPYGSTSATFTITTNAVASSTTATISAMFNGVTQTATLGILSAVQLTSVTLNPTAVIGGVSSTGTVTLNAAAPTGGIGVSLSSNNAAATVPASVTVLAGSTTATFTVGTTGVATNTPVIITAGYNSASVTGTLTINAPTLTSLSLNPSAVISGNSSTGTVTLTGIAPAGGAVVTLGSNNAAATVPATVTVPAGTLSTTFTAATTAGATGTATITATYNGSSPTVVLTFTAPSVSSVSLNPSTVVSGNNSTGTVTLSSVAPTGGAVVSLSSNNVNATVPATIIVPANASSATFTVTTGANIAGTATITASYSSTSKTALLTFNPPGLISIALNPTTVIAGNTSTGTVNLNIAAPPGGTTVSLSSNNSGVTVPVSVTVPASAMSATFTITTVTTATGTATITASFNNVSVTALLTLTNPGLSSVSLNPTTVMAGGSSTGTVLLNSPAPTAGIVVALSSSNTGVTVPANVTVAAGNTAATFTVTTAPTATGTSTITASYSSVTKTATLSITSTALSSLSLNPTTVTAGNTSTGTVTLTLAAPTGGVTVNLASNGASATVPASVTVPAGSTSATFTVTTTAGLSGTPSISATYGTVTKSATLTVTATALSTVSLNPTSVAGGTTSVGTVTLTRAAPTGGTVVALSSNTTSATVPASVTIAAGSTTATFNVTTTGVTTQTTATITASYNSVSKTASLTITVPALSAVSLNPVSVTGGASSTGTVTLTGPAPTGGIAVTLSSSTTSATVPATVTVPAGGSSATFTVTTTAVTTLTTATIKGTYGSVSKTATLTIMAAGAGYGVSFTTSNNQVTITWTAPAGHSNYDAINLTGDDAVDWWYFWQGNTGSANSGTFTVTLPTAPGLYQIQYVANSGQVMATTADIPIAVTGFSVTANQTTAATKSTLTGTWTAPTGRPQTWADTIGLYKVGTTNDQPIWSQYTLGATSGTFSLTAPGTPGEYEFRYVTDYPMTARSATITLQ